MFYVEDFDCEMKFVFVSSRLSGRSGYPTARTKVNYSGAVECKLVRARSMSGAHDPFRKLAERKAPNILLLIFIHFFQKRRYPDWHPVTLLLNHQSPVELTSCRHPWRETGYLIQTSNRENQGIWDLHSPGYC